MTIRPLSPSPHTTHPRDVAPRHETALRALVKGVIWTLMGLITMSVVGFAMTGSWSTGGTMALINSAVGLLFYVLYERLWARIGWGRHV